jgi:hypothetical protein
VRGEQLIEVQTGNFADLRDKLAVLLRVHPVLVLYPIAVEKWIVHLPVEGDAPISRRRSPKRGRVTDLFDELVRVAALLGTSGACGGEEAGEATRPADMVPALASSPLREQRPSLTLQVVFTREEQIRRDDGKGSWRRKGVSIVDRRLLEVVDSRAFCGAQDYAALLPEGLDSHLRGNDGVTCRDIARALGIRLPQARRMVYCLHRMGVLEPAGKRVRERLWRRSDA